MNISKVGIVGAGIMGAGIAQVCAQAGYTTILLEVNQQLLDKGITAIKASLSRSLEKGILLAPDMNAALNRLTGTLSYHDFRDCNLVIEAVTENIELKREVFAELDKICPQQTILSTNTSCLSVLDIASATKRLDKVVGLHFFNPVPVMKLVEVVKTIVASNDTIETIKTFGQSLGKEVIIAKDAPGFVVNRLLLPYLFDCIRLLEIGYATREDFDKGVKLGLSYPMGPFTLCDLLGLDTLCFIASAMYDETKDDRFVPPLLLKKMVTAGQLGRKSGKGFYDYQ